jgi:hypothetical protein
MRHGVPMTPAALRMATARAIKAIDATVATLTMDHGAPLRLPAVLPGTENHPLGLAATRAAHNAAGHKLRAFRFCEACEMKRTSWCIPVMYPTHSL